MVSTNSREKEKFLIFARVLIKYLEHKDANLHQQAKQVIKDCAEKNKRKVPGYESVTMAMERHLRELVGELYWKRTGRYLKHFLEMKEYQAIKGFFLCAGDGASEDHVTHAVFDTSATKFPEGTFHDCRYLAQMENRYSALLSVEIPKDFKCKQALKFRNCESLVNIALPSTVDYLHESAFERCYKLKQFFPNHRNLVIALKGRFYGLPMHELCYYQPYYSSEIIEKRLQEFFASSVSSAENIKDAEKVDTFGMTPFHILALSATTNLYILQSLMHYEPYSNIIDKKDKWGCRPLDYLCMSNTPSSLEAIDMVLKHILNHRLNGLGLEHWKADVLDTINSFSVAVGTVGDVPSVRKDRVSIINSKLELYERLGATSLLELAVWKRKINESTSIQAGRHAHKRAKIDRQCLRVNCRADVVIYNILPFLDKFEMEKKHGLAVEFSRIFFSI